MTPTTTRTSTRNLAASRRHMEDAADRWSEQYDQTFGLFLEHALTEIATGVSLKPDMEALIETASNRATFAANCALEAYESRWPGV